MGSPCALELIGPVNPDALRGLPLSPIDLFVLSRVDGRADVDTIAKTTGLDRDLVTEAARHLEELGLVREASARTASAGEREYDRRSRDDDIELPADLRKQIDVLFAKLATANHYELLGVATDADKKTIKRAYYELAAVFHPDRYFRKRLGSYTGKLETIFARLTAASDALGAQATRSAYDATLPPSTRAVRAESPASAEQVESARIGGIPAAPPVTPPPPVSPRSAATPPPSPPPPTPSRPPLDERARRELLARKLLAGRSTIPPRTASGGSRAAPHPPAAQPRGRDASPSSSAPSSAPPSSVPPRAGSFPPVDPRGRVAQAERALKEAAKALAAGDAEGADRAVRDALLALPEDPTFSGALRGEAIALSVKVVRLLEEKAVNAAAANTPAAAAKLLTRAADLARGDARLADRAAAAVLAAKGNLHEAAALAQRAITNDPRNALYHATLARVYLAAGLPRNALREIDVGEQLAPGDATLALLRKRIAP